MRSESSYRLRVGIAITGAAAVALTGCSSSSSGGGGPTPTPSESLPAAHTETFPNVSPKANKLIQKVLPVMRGVASNTYSHRTLVVTFTPTATRVDQANVENVVKQDQIKTGGTPTKPVVQPASRAIPQPTTTASQSTPPGGKRVKGKPAPTITPSGHKVKKSVIPIGGFKTSPPPKN